MKRWAIYSIFITATLASCGEPSNRSSAQNTSGDPPPIYVEPIPPKPPHNYAQNEGRDYAYIAEVSEEEKKAGKVAGDVLMFRYLGKKDGVHTVALLSNSGIVINTSTCAEPCVVIKNRDGSRTAYTPNSIIGSVFQDAINGYLEGPTARNSGANPQGSGEAASAEIPVAFRGEWNDDPSACGTGSNDSRLRISAAKLQFYESDAEVKTVKLVSARAVSIRTISTGEGQTWNSDMDLILSRSGNELTIRSGGYESTRSKCT